MRPLINSRYLLFSLVMALVLTSCGNIPRPFEPNKQAFIPILESPSTLGSGVLALPTDKPQAGQDLAEDIVAQLREYDIPSESVDRLGLLGYSLEGSFSEERPSDQGAEALIEWSLKNRSGESIQTFSQSIPMKVLDGERLSDESRKQVGQNLASRIADSLGFNLSDIPPTSDAPPVKLIGDGLSVIIRPPFAAPGDGAESLAQTLANRLAQQGFSPAKDTWDLEIIGMVHVSNYDTAQDDIVITWRVVNTTGEDLGEVKLENRIRRGELDRRWGLIAEAVIDSAFPGLMGIISSTKE